MLRESIYPVACLQCHTKDAWPVSVTSNSARLEIRLKCRACEHEWTTQTDSDNAVTPAPTSALQRPSSFVS